MIVDGFTFFNELDLLDIRLEELYPVVDRFVIVEGDQSFRGNVKPANFVNNIGRYGRYMDKIVYLTAFMGGIGHPDPNRAPWEREYHQRRTIDSGITDLAPDDIVLISDIDEIPRRDVVADLPQYMPGNRQVTLAVKRYIYGINLEEGGWHSVKAVSYKNYTDAQSERMTPPGFTIPDAGWEFTSCGTPEQISYKLRNFAHIELDDPYYTDPEQIRNRAVQGLDLYDRHANVRRVEIDDTWPEAIKNDRERYRHLEW